MTRLPSSAPATCTTCLRRRASSICTLKRPALIMTIKSGASIWRRIYPCSSGIRRRDLKIGEGCETERVKGVEPSTSGLESLHSAIELHPHACILATLGVEAILERLNRRPSKPCDFKSEISDLKLVLLRH